MELVNQWSWLIVLLLSLIPAGIICALIRASSGNASDHVFHVTQIGKIAEAGHKFVDEIDFFLIKPDVIYPQLIHWCLSFIRPGRAIAVGTYLSSIFTVLSVWLLAGFAFLVYPHVVEHMPVSRGVFIAGVVSIYVLTPYSYCSSNAKNVGMSGRAVGLFLCELYVYLIVLYVLGGGTWLLLPAVGVVFLILASGIFSMQFVLLSAPIFALLYWSPTLLLPPLAGLAMFAIVFRRYAIAYAIGQWHHKHFYSRYLAERYIVKLRPSIWMDFVRDFWIGSGYQTGRDHRGDFGLQAVYRKLDYIYGNAVVLILVGMPALTCLIVLCVVWMFGGSQTLDVASGPTLVLLAPVAVSLVLFVATSFRKTRFLGEPERYVEVSNGVIVVIVASFVLTVPWMYMTLLVASVVVTGLSLAAYAILIHLRLKQSSSSIEAIREDLFEARDSRGGTLSVMSNNIGLAKMFMDVRVRVVYGWAVFKVGGVPFLEAFERFPLIAPPVVPAVAESYDVDYLVIETETMEDHRRILDDGGVELEQVRESAGLILYRVVGFHPPSS